MSNSYDVVINTSKYMRVGKLTLDFDKDMVTMYLDITDEGTAEGRGTRTGKDFDLAGSATVGEGTIIEFTAHGSIWANALNINADTSVGEVFVYGTETGISAGDFAGNNPTFAGRWADA